LLKINQIRLIHSAKLTSTSKSNGPSTHSSSVSRRNPTASATPAVGPSTPRQALPLSSPDQRPRCQKKKDQRPLQRRRRPWRRRLSSTRCSSARATATSGTPTSRTPSRPTSPVCTRPRTLPLHFTPVICAWDLGSDGFLVLEFLLLQTAASRCGGERPQPRRSPSLRFLSFQPLVFRRSAETYLVPHLRRVTRALGDFNHGRILLHCAFALFSCY
jgi:hypothetical protein